MRLEDKADVADEHAGDQASDQSAVHGTTHATVSRLIPKFVPVINAIQLVFASLLFHVELATHTFSLFCWLFLGRLLARTLPLCARLPTADVVRLMLVLLALPAILPVVSHLTTSISDDTLYVTAVLMLCSHLALRSYDTASAKLVTGRLAMAYNAAVFATVCLSSRLQDKLDVSLTLFVGMAILPSTGAASKTKALLDTCFVTLWAASMSSVLLACVVVALSFLWLGLPLWWCRLSAFKR